MPRAASVAAGEESKNARGGKCGVMSSASVYPVQRGSARPHRSGFHTVVGVGATITRDASSPKDGTPGSVNASVPRSTAAATNTGTLKPASASARRGTAPTATSWTLMPASASPNVTVCSWTALLMPCATRKPVNARSARKGTARHRNS